MTTSGSVLTFFTNNPQYLNVGPVVDGLKFSAVPPVTQFVTDLTITASLYSGRSLINPNTTPGTIVSAYGSSGSIVVPYLAGGIYQVLVPMFVVDTTIQYVLVLNAPVSPSGYQFHIEQATQVLTRMS